MSDVLGNPTLAVKLPACECGAVTGRIVSADKRTALHAADGICSECGKHRVNVSELTLRTLTRISQMFGAPTEPIVFRSTDSVAEKIQQQDLWLKTHYGPDGRSQFQIITDTLNGVDDGPPSDSGGSEAVETETEL
jgi:hypothetical protein